MVGLIQLGQIYIKMQIAGQKEKLDKMQEL
jgi:hypothetical protein